MKSIAGIAFLACAVAVAGACATTDTAGEPAAGGRAGADLAALDAALAQEKDDAKKAALLFQRGHASLEAAERVRDRPDAKTRDPRESPEFLQFMLRAVTDFEAVAARHRASAEAPEALFHLGVAHDGEHLSSLELAVKYYKRVIEAYPDTESARKARVALDAIKARMHEALGAHPEPK